MNFPILMFVGTVEEVVGINKDNSFNNVSSSNY